MRTINLLTAQVLESIIQRLLKLDPDSVQKLAAIEGKKIAVELTDWQLTYVFDVQSENISVLSVCEEACHVHIKGTSFAFFNMANTERGGDALFKGEVHFSGEISTAQKFQAFWQNLEVDWEEELSKYTGDMLAHQMGKLAKKAEHTLKHFVKTAQLNLSEYLREEARFTPDRQEVEDFYTALDDLKSDVDRLQARVNRLQDKQKNT